MLDFLKENFRPADITSVILLLAPGTAALFVPSLAKWGRRWVAVVVIGYTIMSTQAGAGLFSRTLSHGYRPIVSADEARDAQAIVVLGGGSINLRANGRQLSSVTMDAGLRVLEAARLFDLLKGSAEGPLVIASGGVTERETGAAPETAALQSALIDAGVPADRILLESESKNTRQEVIIIRRMLTERRIDRFVLVTSPLHIRRSMLAFEQQGLHPIASPARLVPERRARSVLWPSNMWLSITDDAIYEWLARAYYWWNGWLG
jgi:uncharacterized SAM-binding protein YcdF (DUF218 family)